MTWLDIIVLIIWVAFLAIGARMGSLWTAGCLIGGFFAAYLVDMYAIAVAGMMGNFNGAVVVAAILLYAGGLLVFALPAWFLSKLLSSVFLGIVDSGFGLVTGAFVAVITTALALLVVVPHTPRVEKTKVWKQSKVVAPFHRTLEEFFDQPTFRPGFLTEKLKDSALESVEPIAENATEKIKDVSGDLVDKIKK
jgi:uncharacterized membrane protein required for colicin V production